MVSSSDNQTRNQLQFNNSTLLIAPESLIQIHPNLLPKSLFENSDLSAPDIRHSFILVTFDSDGNSDFNMISNVVYDGIPTFIGLELH